MTKFRIKREWYSLHFKSFLASKNRYQVLFGGRGGGKTHNIILKLIGISFLEEYNHIVYVNKVFADIRKNQFKDIIKVLKALGLTKYFNINKTNYGFKNLITGTEFTALGMDNAENTKGLSDPTIIWWDEINKGTQDDFTTLNALLRTPLNKNHQFIISFNPVDENSWLRTFLFEKDNGMQLKSAFVNSFINHSTFNNNEFIDREKYNETLMLNYAHNQNLLDVNLYGLWGKAEVEAPFAQRFDKTKHVKKLEYKGKVYRLSFDFNVNPITCIIATDNGKKAQILKEFRLSDSDIYKLCSEIRAWLPIGCYIEVTGDSTGSNRSAMTQGNINYYDIIEKELRISRRQIRTPTYNIGHENSRALMNSLFIENLIELDESCKWLIDDLVYCEVLPDGHINKKKNEASNMGHLLDCLRYLLATFYNTRK